MGFNAHRAAALAAAANIVLLAAPAGAQQQVTAPAASVDAGEGDGADIVVTGIRRSLADAAAIKRASAVISDVVSAEDIGRFPDQNLAESLQRVTGVQITRNKGEGAAISVRGLSPNMTLTQYNGRNITTTSGGRSFNFTSLTSDFVNAVEVSKTPTADMLDGGLAATVNVKTGHPLDIGRNRFALTAEGIYEDNARKATPHIAGYVNRILVEDRLGVNFGVNYEKRRILTFNYSAYGLENGIESGRVPPLDYNLDGDTKDTFRFNHGAGLTVSDGYNERLTFIGGIQARVAEILDLHVDGFYSAYKDVAAVNASVLRFTNIAGPRAAVRGSVVQDGVLTFLDADGVDLRNSSFSRQVFDDETLSVAAGGKLNLDRLAVSGEVTTSKSRREASSPGLNVLGRASASYDLRPDRGGIAQVAFTRGYDPLNPANFNAIGFTGPYKAPTEDRNRDARLDLHYDAGRGFLRALMAGGVVSDRRNSFVSSTVRLGAKDLAGALGVPYDATLERGSFNAAPFMQLVSYPRALDNYKGSGLLPKTFLISSNDLLYAKLPLDRLLALSPPVSDPARNFSVRERVLAAYARADFATTDDHLSGNVGLRYVRTRQRSDGFAPDLSLLILAQQGSQAIIPGATPTSVRNDYDAWLPSLNARYDLTDHLVARIGIARAMTRPDLNLLSPSTSVNGNVRTITRFNPMLRPFLANQADLSLEYYFRKSGLVSLAMFYKDLKNFVVNTARASDVTLRFENGSDTTTLPFTFLAPANGTGGKLKGIEAGAQVPLDFLPSPLDGFGVIANATWLDAGKVNIVDGGPKLPLSGVSKWSYNLAGYYEKAGFGVRLSYNYRSSYTVDPNSSFGDGQFNRAYGQFDASMSYDVSPALTLSLDATNLNQSAVQSYNSFGVGRGFEDVGRRFTAGVRAKF